MNLEEIEKLYLHRQSCRAFDKTREVPHELLEKICNLALLAPSACNSQPWVLYCVTGERLAAVAKSVQDLGMNKFASDATALIAIAESKGNLTATVGSRFKDSDFLHNDIGILTAHLVLAADAAGLGTCILGWRNEKKLQEALSLDKDVRIPLVIAVGYPEENYEIRPKKRKETDKTLHFINE